MGIGKFFFFIKRIRENAESSTVNLRRRFLAFMLILMLTTLTGVLFLLSVSGVFRYGWGETEKLMQSELNHLSAGISNQYGGASVQAVKMSERLSAKIAAFLRREEISPADFKSAPQLLSSLLADLLPDILSSLDATDCSGAFVTLDTTVNPNITGAEYSKAGLYIRAIEPNISGIRNETRYLLRGPSILAGDGRLNLQAKWNLEFNVMEQLFWSEPIAAYEAAPLLPLSRLVYWCAMSPIQGLNENVMVCSVPVLDEFGNIFGVCGFEIGQMNFMLRREPEIGGFHKAVSLFSTHSGGNLKLDGALYSGNTAVYQTFPENGFMNRTGNTGEFTLYSVENGASYIGMEREIRLYPNDSPYADKSFAAALIIPKADFDAVRNEVRMRLGLIFFVLTAAGIAASMYLSKRFVKPITDKLSEAAQGGFPEKTNIVEIDQLLEKIKELRSKDNPLPDNLFEDFIARVKSLTKTEMEIFRHYAAGKNINDIPSLMFISAHTLKNHNTHIYQKLEVSSKDELMLYVELIKKSGLENEIL